MKLSPELAAKVMASATSNVSVNPAAMASATPRPTSSGPPTSKPTSGSRPPSPPTGRKSSAWRGKTTRSKYRNTKTEVGGITFDSKKEATRWTELLGLLRAGKISGLIRQKIFRIVVNGVRVCNYVSDFCFWEGGKRVVEDVKSPMTRKLPVYVLKRKLMAAVFDIAIREV